MRVFVFFIERARLCFCVVAVDNWSVFAGFRFGCDEQTTAIKTALAANVVAQFGCAAVAARLYVRRFYFIVRAAFAFALFGVSMFWIWHDAL